jgi:hypothetical protein
MARTRPEGEAIRRDVTVEERAIIEAIATRPGFDATTKQRAAILWAILSGGNRLSAAVAQGTRRETARSWARKFEEESWKALLNIQAPRGGDFLARYDQGYWAEHLVKECLEASTTARPIPYGTSRSEPFTSLAAFRVYRETEFLLQAWSARRHWKRPDLLIIPRAFLTENYGNDLHDPGLKTLDNDRCAEHVAAATAAIEVETSLWIVSRARASNVALSFTVKDEDLESLRNWITDNRVPLYIIQVFYDEVYILPFTTVEQVIALPAEDPRRVVARVDDETNKRTYFVPLSEGILLGRLSPEPEVEGKVFKAENGRVTVYGRLSGSSINVVEQGTFDSLIRGTLGSPGSG